MTTATATAARAVDSVQGLPVVGLEELLAAADLQTRIDRKYVLPLDAVDAVVTASASGGALVQALELDGVRAFGYRSVYLDTDDLKSFHSAGRGRRRRFKVRSRAYIDSGVTWLEVKVAGPRGTTIKERVRHPDVASDGLLADGRGFVRDRLAFHGVDLAETDALRPVLVSTYRRSTLLLAEAGRHGRATIDVDLAWSGTRGPGRLGWPGVAVIETKAGATPTVVDRALWRLGHRPVRISKYGTGLAALSPELPHLKWHRVLTRCSPQPLS